MTKLWLKSIKRCSLSFVFGRSTQTQEILILEVRPQQAYTCPCAFIAKNDVDIGALRLYWLLESVAEASDQGSREQLK